MQLIISNMASRKDFLLEFVRMILSRLFIIINRVTFSVVSLATFCKLLEYDNSNTCCNC